jgi:hypothetical protein
LIAVAAGPDSRLAAAPNFILQKLYYNICKAKFLFGCVVAAALSGIA